MTTSRKPKSKATNGDGSVFRIEKNGREVWIAQVSLGQDITGKRKYTRRSCPTETAAKKLLRDMLFERDRGTLNQQTQETIHSLGMYWATQVKPLSVRTTTASGYEDLLRRYVFPYIGRIRIAQVKATDIQTLVWQLKESGKSTSTVNQVRRILHGFFNYAQRQGYIGHNPVQAVEAVKRQHGEKTQVQTPWSLEEATQALTVARNDDLMDCFLHIMLLTGFRPGEAMGLRWSDVDFENNMLHVTGTLRVDRRILPNGDGVSKLARNDPKNFSSGRSLPIHPELRAALERQQMRLSLWRIQAAETWVDSDYVITTLVGTPKDPSNNRHHFYRFLKAHEIRRIRPHDIRHVVAARALESDVRLEDVSQALGHTRLDTTKQIYAGIVPRLNDRFVEGIGDLFSLHTRAEIRLETFTEES